VAREFEIYYTSASLEQKTEPECLPGRLFAARWLLARSQPTHSGISPLHFPNQKIILL
jgi:hypothetical protein